MDPNAQSSDERHLRIAQQIRAGNASVIDDARRTLARWRERSAPLAPHPVLDEWHAVLTLLRPDELATFLESTTPRARRLRSSSPFVE